MKICTNVYLTTLGKRLINLSVFLKITNDKTFVNREVIHQN